MSNRLGGVLTIIAGSVSLQVRGTCTLRYGLEEREGVAGETGVHGYTATTTVAGVDVEVTHDADFDLEEIYGADDLTIQIALKDKRNYIMSDAWYRASGGGEMDLVSAGMTLNFDSKFPPKKV